MNKRQRISIIGFFPVILFSLISCSTITKDNPVPLEITLLGEAHQQAVFVQSKKQSGSQASVSVWETSRDGWREVRSFPAVIGRNGMASFNEKAEGDGRTPSGTFKLERAFGYAARVSTGLEYKQVTSKDFWIDASHSPEYNQWVTGDIPAVSHEKLRRDDDLYKYGIVIEYNTNPVVAGKGSAIFIHIWRGANQSTAGCVAAAEHHIAELLKWLDKTQNPVVVLK